MPNTNTHSHSFIRHKASAPHIIPIIIDFYDTNVSFSRYHQYICCHFSSNRFHKQIFNWIWIYWVFCINLTSLDVFHSRSGTIIELSVWTALHLGYLISLGEVSQGLSPLVISLVYLVTVAVHPCNDMSWSVPNGCSGHVRSGVASAGNNGSLFFGLTMTAKDKS